MAQDEATRTVERLRRQQAALAAFGSFAFKETDLFAILNEAARICAASLGVPFCKICRYRSEEDDLLIEAGCGWHTGVIGQVVSQADETSPQGRAFITRQPVIIHDLQHSNNLILPKFYPQHGIVSTIDVIIAAMDGTPYGVLEIDSPHLHLYDEHDVNFLTGFANVLAEAVFRTKKNKTLQEGRKLEAIGQLTGGIAHDFNNLLAIVINYLDLARQSLPQGDDTRQMITEALSAAMRGASLTQHLLTFARRQALNPSRIDVNQQIIETYRLLSRTLGGGVEIGLNLGSGIWPALADPTHFEACLINLATNARDAMPDGGTLSITTSNRHVDAGDAPWLPDLAIGGYVMIEVSDTGTGIAPKTLEKIFDPFFTTKPEGKGTGLGLSMVFGFLKQSQGHIDVSSELGVGTTFRLYLPRLHESASPVPSPPPASRPSHGHGERILVVDDQEAVRRSTAMLLASLDYTVIEADGAEAALAVLARQSIDLVLSDIGMPGAMDGIALAGHIMATWPAIKLILVSGLPHTQLQQPESILRGEVPILSKPYRGAEMAKALHSQLHPDQPQP